MDTTATPIKAVILDLDQTITVDQASWLQFTELLGADVDEHVRIFEAFKAGNIDYAEAKKQLMSVWRHASKLDRESITTAFGKVQLRPGAVDAIAYLQKKYHLCIISGAIDVFVNTFADQLGIRDRYAATKFIFDDSDKLIDFQYKLSRGEDKLEFLHDFCSKNGLSVKECAAIGDGESDMPLFEEVAMPILFIADETTTEQKQLIQSHLHRWNEIAKLM